MAILIVEDLYDDQQILCALLRAAGFDELLVVETG